MLANGPSQGRGVGSEDLALMEGGGDVTDVRMPQAYMLPEAPPGAPALWLTSPSREATVPLS